MLGQRSRRHRRQTQTPILHAHYANTRSGKGSVEASRGGHYCYYYNNKLFDVLLLGKEQLLGITRVDDTIKRATRQTMRTFQLPAPLLLLLLLQTGSSLAVDNDFSAYPEGSQQCLYDSADDAGCSSGSSGEQLNQCLCKNQNNFVYNTASCIGKNSPSDAIAVYETLSSNCAGTGVTLSVSKPAFIAYVNQAAASTTTTSPTTTSTGSTESPTSTDNASSGDELSTVTKIGIGVGVGFGTVAAALAAWFIWSYRKRHRSAESVHSTDPRGGESGTSYGGAGAFSMANAPRHEYAQDNSHQGAVELASSTWTPPTSYTTPPYEAGAFKKDGTDGMPLLAELGNEPASQQRPVELPANPDYLGYNDRGPSTPDGLSPSTYSHSGRGDVSPFTPSRSSEAGTY